MPGAKNAVETCLAVKPGEHVALIADEASRSVAASLAAALADRHAACTGLLLEDFGPRPHEGRPRRGARRSRNRRRRCHVHDARSRESWAPAWPS